MATQELCTNPDFDDDTLGQAPASWEAPVLAGLGAVAVSALQARSGTKSLYLEQDGINGQALSYIEFTFTPPLDATETTISLWGYAQCEDPRSAQGAERLKASMYQGTEQTIPVVWEAADNGQWVQRSFNLGTAYNGMELTLRIQVEADGDNYAKGWIDDVSILATVPDAPASRPVPLGVGLAFGLAIRPGVGL